MRWRVFLRSAVVRLSRILRIICQYSCGHIDEILEDLESLLGATGKRVLTIKVEIDDIMTSDNHLHVNGVANVGAAAKTDPKKKKEKNPKQRQTENTEWINRQGKCDKMSRVFLLRAGSGDTPSRP